MISRFELADFDDTALATPSNLSGELSKTNGKSIGDPTQNDIHLNLDDGMLVVEEGQRRKDLGSIRARIIEKAMFVFAKEYGKWDAEMRIRRICGLACVTREQLYELFPTMTDLYQEILKSLFDHGRNAYPLDGGLTPDAPARERLLAFVRSMLYRQLGYQGAGFDECEKLLLAREVAKPSPNFIQTVLDSMVPSIQYLFQVVGDLLGPRSTSTTIRYCAFSVLNQCIHYGRDQDISKKMHLGLDVSYEEIEELADHITDFSLGGMHRVLENQGRWQRIETDGLAEFVRIRKQVAAIDSIWSDEGELQDSRDGKVTSVTFYCHAPYANEVFLVGDFNNWDPQANPMTRNSSGEWFVKLDLPSVDCFYHVVIDGRRCATAAYHVLE